MNNIRTVLLLLLLASPLALLANNVQLTNLGVSSSDPAADHAMVSFTLTWENSWRDAENHDAVWVFLKFRPTAGSGSWSHATLTYVDGINDGHSVPAAGTVSTTPDGLGVFISRSGMGDGTLTLANVELRWDYGADGLADNASPELSAHAIEMVYIPQGAFFVGDGSNGTIHGQFEEGTSGNPLAITSEGALTLGGGAAGSLGNHNRVGMANEGLFSITGSIDDFDDATPQTLPAAFPKGFEAFYCMKYELTQGQYAEFLNQLDAPQAATRYDATNFASANGGSGTTRYNITGTWPNFTTITPCLSATYVEWPDAAAYADWAGLRPMTELEFEKACRGIAAPVANEYAWGNVNLANTTYWTINDQDLLNESIGANYNSSGAGNAWYTDTRAFPAPVRVGIFADNAANTGRVTSGATYYGVFEMSGLCWERVVTVGRPESRVFAGSHGDGNLNAVGNADNADWPGLNGANGVDNAFGGGYRGGAFEFPTPTDPNLRISSRILSTAFYNIRYFDDTARFIRTAN